METHSASAHVLIPERVSIVLGCSRYFRLGLRPHLSVAADCFVRMSGHCYTVDVVDSYWVESATVVLPVPQVLPEETASARLLDFVRRTRPARIFSSASGPHRRHRAARQRSTWNRVQDVTTRLSTHTHYLHSLVLFLVWVCQGPPAVDTTIYAQSSLEKLGNNPPGKPN